MWAISLVFPSIIDSSSRQNDSIHDRNHCRGGRACLWSGATGSGCSRRKICAILCLTAGMDSREEQMRDRLCKMLGIDIPIVLAPMGGAVAPRLAAAVSNAGALGTLPLWRSEIKTLRSAVQKTRSLTTKPFALNLNMEFPQT